MKIKSHNFIIFIIFIIPSLSEASCDHTCGGRNLPFPFGFSAGCGIQLKCSAAGTILAGEFPVESVNDETILVNLPPTCGRPVEALRRLFTASFAPTSQNAIILHDCLNMSSGCVIPMSWVKNQFEMLDCASAGNSTISCYSKPDNATSFIDYRDLTRSGCRSLFSAISTEAYGNSSSVSLDVQVVRVGWWLRGGCRCSRNAKCVAVSPPPLDDEVPTAAYRCECFEGFAGDGFLDGEGCRKENVSGACNECLHGGGQCLADIENNFYCKTDKGRWKLIIAICIPIAAVVLLLVAFFIIWLRKRRLGRAYLLSRNLSSDPSSNSDISGNHAKSKDGYEKNIEIFLKNNGNLAPIRYRYSSIKKITNSFGEKVGRGGFGSVYKGQLPDGHLVAVKVLNESNGNVEDFMNEVSSISRTSHIHIVTLLGFCSEGSERALVYDFMPNGSLEKFIGNNVAESALGWDKLFEIALGIARGLEYLHQGCNTRIVHLDIKPQNILLDKDFIPRISDFGLAKLCPNRSSTVSMMVARGTIGYIAPEVFSRNFGKVSYKSDVYSYGMLVLEMAGGRRNVDRRDVDRTSEIYFPHYIYKELEKDANRDFDLVGTMHEDESQVVKRTLIIVGLWCIQTNPKDRPSMTKVVEMLEGKLGSLEVPPEPYLYSPPRSAPTFSCSESL